MESISVSTRGGDQGLADGLEREGLTLRNRLLRLVEVGFPTSIGMTARVIPAGAVLEGKTF